MDSVCDDCVHRYGCAAASSERSGCESHIKDMGMDEHKQMMAYVEAVEDGLSGAFNEQIDELKIRMAGTEGNVGGWQMAISASIRLLNERVRALEKAVEPDSIVGLAADEQWADNERRNNERRALENEKNGKLQKEKEKVMDNMDFFRADVKRWGPNGETVLKGCNRLECVKQTIKAIDNAENIMIVMDFADPEEETQ